MMNKTMMTKVKGKKALWGLMLLPLLLILFYFRSGDMGFPHGRQPELQTFQLGDGWGYRIMMNNKVLIYQPTIPAIDTACSFPSEESARRVGSIVLDRLRSNRDFSVTATEIKHSLSK